MLNNVKHAGGGMYLWKKSVIFLLMKEQNTLRWIIPAILLSLVGIGTLQVLLLLEAYRQKDEAFSRSVINAMEKTARSLEIREAEYKVSSLIRETGDKDRVLISERSELVPPPGDDDSLAIKIRSPKGLKATDSVWVQDGVIAFRRQMTPENNLKREATETTRMLKSPDGMMIKQIFTTTPDVRKKNDSLMIYVTSDGKTTRISDPDSFRTFHRKELVASVFDVFSVSEGQQVEHKIAPSCIDSVLKKSFTESAIDIPFTFAVMAGAEGSLPYVSDPSTIKELRGSSYTSELFAAGFAQTTSKLVVYFPHRKFFLLKSIVPSLAASVVFILVILGSFLYTVGAMNRQKAFSARLTDFINNITHEFKTPISTISVVTDTLNQPEISAQPEKVDHYNAVIRDEIGRMRVHVDKILQLAVLEEGDYEFKMTDMDANESIREAIERSTLKVAERGGEIIPIFGAKNSLISADPYHFLNLVMNLLDNAEKYSPGNPGITVRTGNEENNFWMSVEDRGIGISKEDQQHIFEKYYRVSTGDRHETKGFGLGLSYVKFIVDAHKGMVSISSTPGSGTSIRISLPSVKS